MRIEQCLLVLCFLLLFKYGNSCEIWTPVYPSSLIPGSTNFNESEYGVIRANYPCNERYDLCLSANSYVSRNLNETNTSVLYTFQERHPGPLRHYTMTVEGEVQEIIAFAAPLRRGVPYLIRVDGTSSQIIFP